MLLLHSEVLMFRGELLEDLENFSQASFAKKISAVKI